MKKLKSVLLLFRPLVRKLAVMYGVRLNYHCEPRGNGSVEINQTEEQRQNNIPATVYFNTGSGDIRVGSDSLFGEDVLLLTGKHLDVETAKLEGRELHYVPQGGRDIVIGNSVYIGSGAIIIGPVVIGDFAVIGAGSLVTKNVEAYSVVVGVPAKKIRSLQA